MLKALLIDDEVLGAQALESLLKMYCPGVNVMGIAHSADEAEEKIPLINPDIIFLDIEMPYADGFELLHRLTAYPIPLTPFPDVIFTTAYNEYAIKAIKHNALDYLLKPIDPEELMAAVKKCEEKRGKNVETQNFASLQKMISTMSQAQKVHKLPVPCSEGIVYLDPDNIVYLEGDLNYTHIHLIQGQKITSSRNLKEFEHNLTPEGKYPSGQFFRIHKAHIINLAYVKKYIKGDGGEVVMADGSTLDVSRLRKAELLAMLTV